MRPFLTLVIVLIFTSVAVPVSHAQRDTIAPPVGGVYQAYYEEKGGLATYLNYKNICFERFATLNPNLDYANILYGTLLTLPRNEKCYDYSNGKSISSDISNKAPRLKYYENGQWLEEPYYSYDVQYLSIYNYEEVSRYLNICFEDLLPENYLFIHYPIEYRTGAVVDVFVPQNTSPCYEDWVAPSNYGSTQREIKTYYPSDLTPMKVLEDYNICAESVRKHNMLNFPTIGYNFPIKTTSEPFSLNESPCYNSQGQRLHYYDDFGNLRPEPIYTDLQVYRVTAGQTIPQIVQEQGVCITDLLRINGFPELPAEVEIEIFLPPVQPCPTDIFAQQVLPSEYLDNEMPKSSLDISLKLNICWEILVSLNPHLDNKYNYVYHSDISPTWVLLTIVPPQPCYNRVAVQSGDAIYDIELRLNICSEFFIWHKTEENPIIIKEKFIWHRWDLRPCYDESGKRLDFYQNRTARAFIPPLDTNLSYGEFFIHPIREFTSVYEISRLYNVCVNNLLDANKHYYGYIINFYYTEHRPMIVHPFFIPHGQPCYDERTGLPILYDMSDGVPLIPPQINSNLMHYSSQIWGGMTYIYNVCINHIEDANRAKLDGETSYLGWIIPADRPPCYTGNGTRINYACYAQNGLDTACFDDYSPDRFTLHTISAGESLSSIATQYGVEVWEITWANRLDMRQPLWPDQTLIIPKQSTSAQVYALVLGTFVSLLLSGGLIIPLARQRQNRD